VVQKMLFSPHPMLSAVSLWAVTPISLQEVLETVSPLPCLGGFPTLGWSWQGAPS